MRLGVKNYKWWLNPVWHKMLYSCTQHPYGNSGHQRVKNYIWPFYQVTQWRSCLRTTLSHRSVHLPPDEDGGWRDGVDFDDGRTGLRRSDCCSTVHTQANSWGVGSMLVVMVGVDSDHTELISAAYNDNNHLIANILRQLHLWCASSLSLMIVSLNTWWQCSLCCGCTNLEHSYHQKWRS